MASLPGIATSDVQGGFVSMPRACCSASRARCSCCVLTPHQDGTGAIGNPGGVVASTLGDDAAANTLRPTTGPGLPGSMDSAAGQSRPRHGVGFWTPGTCMSSAVSSVSIPPRGMTNSSTNCCHQAASFKGIASSRFMGLPRNGLSVSFSRAGTGIPAKRSSSQACLSTGAEPNRRNPSSRSDQVEAQCSRNRSLQCSVAVLPAPSNASTRRSASHAAVSAKALNAGPPWGSARLRHSSLTHSSASNSVEHSPPPVPGNRAEMKGRTTSRNEVSGSRSLRLQANTLSSVVLHPRTSGQLTWTTPLGTVARSPTSTARAITTELQVATRSYISCSRASGSSTEYKPLSADR
ncbi:hypothetical protein ACVIYL_004843 [Bradyrhizobium sp. USDA 3315]